MIDNVSAHVLSVLHIHANYHHLHPLTPVKLHSSSSLLCAIPCVCSSIEHLWDLYESIFLSQLLQSCCL